MSVVIIDYEIGNINSIVGALSKLGVNYEFSRDHKIINKVLRNHTNIHNKHFLKTLRSIINYFYNNMTCKKKNI